MIEKLISSFETLEDLSTEELDRSAEKLVLTESNVEKLLSDCAGMSKREVEKYLVALRPKPGLRAIDSQDPFSAGLTSQRSGTGPSAAPDSPGVAKYP